MSNAISPPSMWGFTMWLALLAIAVLMWRPRLHERSVWLSFLLHLALATPFFALAFLFIVNDTSFQHIAAYGGESLPLKYRFAATWAAREGPLLLWLGWMSLLAWFYRKPLPGEAASTIDVTAWRLRTIHGMNLTFLLIAFSLHPFEETPNFFRGIGLNPLLQTDLMVIHPPLIFLAYSFCLHLTAVAISSLYTDNMMSVGERMMLIARPGLFVATLGIGLGGLWAYLILDWGGYWAWDPVETGSFLPWLCLVALVHLRTRPGKTSEQAWIGIGLLSGLLALFATTVTRAGGVWASSIHTFVTSQGGTPPQDVFGRLMEIRYDGAATEVLAYVVWIFMLIGCWIAYQRSVATQVKLSMSSSWVVMLPAFVALLGNLVFSSSSLIKFSWTSVPSAAFVIVLLLPTLAGWQRQVAQQPPSSDAWAYHALTPLPLDVVFTLLIFGLSQDVFITAATAVFFIPLYRAPSAIKAWPWAAAGVMIGLALAWSQLLSIPVAGLMLLMFVLPWLLAGQEEGEPWGLNSRKTQQKMALWGSVLIVSLYLILTWVLLLASIDAVHFEAHELYGAPFLAGLGAALFLYSRRKESTKSNLIFLGCAAGLSVLGLLFAPSAFGADSSEMVSEHLTRGHIVWISLPFIALAVAPLMLEVGQQFKNAKQRGTLRQIPLGAHLVHLGLLLLILGHLSTTVLVDRGDASHRVSLVKDEVIVHQGFGFEFKELLLQSDGLEVGDGFIGARILVYTMDGEVVGKQLGEVQPGTLRFDAQGLPRSEVDSITRATGDLIFIFDGTQAGVLMTSAQEGTLDDIQLVRVTIYNLPHSHAVWLGWCLMMGGMALVSISQTSKQTKLNKKMKTKHAEEE